MVAYTETERSYEDGRPIELYDIRYSGNTWHYTNDVEEITLNNALYVPIAIERGETEDNGDAEKANLQIRISRSSKLADIFRVTPPSEPVTITIRQYHKDFAPALSIEQQTATVWKGRIINIAWENAQMILTSESVFSSLLRVGVTRKYSRQCTHALFGSGCQLNRADFAVIGVVQSQSGLVLNIDNGKELNWFAGGYAEYRNADNGATERRAISESTASSVTLTAFPLGIKAGVTQVTLYAGCNHTHGVCRSKFNNLANYGGQPFIPIQNPFSGTSIY